ncbi:hypothetical protein ACVWWM_002421 [Ewingella americana]
MDPEITKVNCPTCGKAVGLGRTEPLSTFLLQTLPAYRPWRMG